MQQDYLPRQMEVYYKEGEVEHKLKLDHDTIIIDNETYKPTRSEWEIFWDELEEIGIWDWEEEYQACSLVEDYYWQITLLTNSINLYTQGCNSYPVRLVKGELVSALDEFFQAVEYLCGWRIM